jgi:hypothetical protein
MPKGVGQRDKRYMRIDHAELRTRVAERWISSPDIVNRIRFHRAPHRAPQKDPHIPIMNPADSICMNSGIEVGSDGCAYGYYQDVVDQLGHSDADFQETMAAFPEKFWRVEELTASSGGT